MASGDDIEAGRITAGESTTDLLAQRPSEGNVDFNGDTIFRVGPQGGGVTRPAVMLHAIVGIGNGKIPSQGGTGVTGIGGPNHGTGVVGRGGEDDVGSGGVGVHGIGGNVKDLSTGADPGAGVLAQGGTDAHTPPQRGAGVIAVAGGVPVPAFTFVSGVGVYGEGPDVGVKGIASGTLGVGVKAICHGGFGFGLVADATTGTGAVAQSIDGVGLKARSGKGVGVEASSNTERAGVFSTGSAAQIQLIPHRVPKPIPEQPFAARALVATGHEKALPADGRTGDLLCLEMEVTEAGADLAKPRGVLWFCVRGPDGADPARWRQVLLGPDVLGQG